MRYFFRRLDDGIHPDTRGTECADLQAARHQAVIYAAKTFRDHANWVGGELRIEVTGEDGHLATTVVLLSIDSKEPGEFIHVSRGSYSCGTPESLFVIGSGGASRKRRGQNE